MDNQKILPATIGGSMIFFQWDTYFETGNDTIDSQHKDFFSIIDKLQNAIHSENTDHINNLSEEFIAHLNGHFTYENDLMKKLNYPGYFSHKAEHDRFFEKVKRNLKDLDKKPIDEIDSFFEVSYRWFKNHLEINDRKLVKFLKDNNIN